MKSGSRLQRSDAGIYVGARSVRSVQPEIDALRLRCGQSADILTSAAVFLANTSRWKTFPALVVVRQDSVAYGAVLFHGHTVLGIPTGVFQAGHLCGRGAVIAAEPLRRRVVEAAAQALLRRTLAHTVGVQVLLCGARHCAGEGWSPREARSRIDLDGGAEGAMSRFSYKMRRNVRYYRRKAEKDLGCVFSPDLSSAEARQAVKALHALTTYPVPGGRALGYLAALRDAPGAFMMGLRDGSGGWLSFLSGWREGEASYVEWQMNSSVHPASSLSTVMRAYCLEHEAGRGAKRLIFVGGTDAGWSRACLPQVCDDFLAMRRGVLGGAAALARRWLRRREGEALRGPAAAPAEE